MGSALSLYQFMHSLSTRNPSAFLSFLHTTVMHYSLPLATQHGYDLYGKSDLCFLQECYRVSESVLQLHSGFQCYQHMHTSLLSKYHTCINGFREKTCTDLGTFVKVFSANVRCIAFKSNSHASLHMRVHDQHWHLCQQLQHVKIVCVALAGKAEPVRL